MKQVPQRIKTMTAQTAPEKTEAKHRGRVSKEDAAFTITYLDDKNVEHARMPKVVTAVKVLPAGGKAKVVALKEFPPQVLGQMAAHTTAAKLRFFLKDVTKAEAAKVPSLVEEFSKNAKNATLFEPKEGGGPGRAFDFDFWVAVVARVADLKIKAGVKNVSPMSDQAKAAFRAKLEAMAPEQRKEAQKRWEGDKTFRNAVVIVRGERAAARLATEGVDTEAEYDVLADI